ncbi:hypothetical protein D3C75_505800 [compost metagenome]
MDQHAVGTRPQLQAGHLAHRHPPIAHRIPGDNRAAAGGTQHQRQARLLGQRLRRLGVQLEDPLRRAHVRRRLHFQIGTADQCVEIGGACQAQLRTHHPEAAAGASDALLGFGDPNPEQHRRHVVAEAYLLHLADIQTAKAQRRALAQAVAACSTQLDQPPHSKRLLLVGEQRKATKARHRCRLEVGGIEGDAAQHQGLQRLALHLDARQAAFQADAAGIPEARRGVDQAGVIRLDVHIEHHLAAVCRQLVALHAAHANLSVQDRRADVQRPQALGGQTQVQTGGVDIQWRRLGPDAELPRRDALLAETHGEEVALHQRLEAGDAGQRDGRLDHPELAAAQQQLLGARVHGQLGQGPGEVLPHVELPQHPHLHAIEHHRRAPGLQAADVVELQLDAEAGLRRLEVLVEAERECRIGWRAVLSMLRGGKGDTAGGDTDQ